MNLSELREELGRRRVDGRAYVLAGLTSGEPDEGALYVARHGDQWEVGTQERGRREVWACFADESAACLAALGRLDRPGHRKHRAWWLGWT